MAKTAGWLVSVALALVPALSLVRALALVPTLALLPALALAPAGARAQSAPPGDRGTRDPAGARAQSPPPADRGAPDPVAAEIRLLRQAVERLATLTVRSQVLASRLAAQQQRVVREEDTVALTEAAIDAAGRRQERMRATLGRATRALSNVVEEPRSEARREVEDLKAEMDDQDRELTVLRTRLAQAEQSLKSEQQVYTEVDASLSALLREVERPGR